MFQRNRIVLAALALLAAVALATPAAAHAAGFQTGRFPAVDALERAWTWIIHLVAGEAKKPARHEKEGGAINPNGGSTTGFTAPPPTILSGSGGSGK
jgi:hypothetical protein